MKAIIILIKGSILILILSYIVISNNDRNISIKTNNTNNQIKDTEVYKIDNNIGQLYIPILKQKFKLYDFNSKENNIEQNVTFLNDPIHQNTVVLAAHSGIGPIAYFSNLNRLKINDEIILEIKNIKRKYVVTTYDIQTKNGYITWSKSNDNILILTTCLTNYKNKQLVIVATEKT